MTERQPQAMQSGRVVFEICEWTDCQTDTDS